MNLTRAQLTTLNADIAADPTLASLPHTSDSADTVATVYNLPATPTYWVWRTSLALKEVYEATSVDGTTWSTPAYIGRSAAERDAWRDVYAMPGVLNPSLANARTGIADIFSGPAGAGQRAHLLALGRRTATRAEHLFALGAEGTPASPATMGAEGALTIANVLAAWAVG